MNLNEWRDYCFQAMEAKGFHDGRDAGRDDTLLRLCLVHTEVSEAAQLAKRHFLPGCCPDEHLLAFSEEIADVLIRLFDLAGTLDLDLEAAVQAKMAKNAARPHKYGTPWAGQEPCTKAN